MGYLESENILRKFDVNYSENKNASGGTCARGAKRPHVGVFTCCVIVFFSVFVYVKFVCDYLKPFFAFSYP